MSDKKPMIRHCKNCKWGIPSFCHLNCSVKYKLITDGRAKALFCRYFKMKEVQDEPKSN